MKKRRVTLSDPNTSHTPPDKGDLPQPTQKGKLAEIKK